MTKSEKIGEKYLSIRAELWPGLDETLLWDRKTCDGFTTVPRGLPYILSIMNDHSTGANLTETYLGLWCRVYDQSFVTIQNQREMAFEVGFTGQRAEQAWKIRMKKLEELGFIKSKPGSAGEFSHVLLLNPYKVIKEMNLKQMIKEEKYNALITRMEHIGAKDLKAKVVKVKK